MIDVGTPEMGLLIVTAVLAYIVGRNQGKVRGYAEGWIEREEDHGPRYPLQIAEEADRRIADGEIPDQIAHLHDNEDTEQ